MILFDKKMKIKKNSSLLGTLTGSPDVILPRTTLHDRGVWWKGSRRPYCDYDHSVRVDVYVPSVWVEDSTLVRLYRLSGTVDCIYRFRRLTGTLCPS